MTPARRQRLIIISLIVACVGVAVGLALFALSQDINLYYSPTQVHYHKVPSNQIIRIGGIVQKNTVHHSKSSMTVTFDLTDTAHSVLVKYTGILPNLFRVGQGIVAQGRMQGGEFIADQVLAKHDSTYMPKNVEQEIQAAKTDIVQHAASMLR